MPLVVEEEECLVLEDRPTDVPPNWFWREIRLGAPRAVVEEVIRVEGVVAEEVVPLPVQLFVPDLICRFTTPPSDRPNSAEYVLVCILNSSSASTLGKMHDGLQPRLVVVDAVEHVVVVARALAVGRERGRRAPGEAAGAVDVRPRNAAKDARNRACQADEVAAVQRQRLDLLFVDRRPQLRRRGLEQRRRRLIVTDSVMSPSSSSTSIFTRWPTPSSISRAPQS